MFIDTVRITIKAGNGGAGASTFRRTGQTAKGGPDGGNGGNGGNIYFKGSHNETDLREFRYKKRVVALDGTPGRRKNLYGKNAIDTVIPVPFGTTIKDLDTGNEYEVGENTEPILIARGGKGGRGNYEFRTPTDQAPTYFEKGEKGQERNILLDLRIIADVGIIGLPNAGKSSMLSLLTNALPAIGDYPFTTLEPSLGVLQQVFIADIPGLIEGASKGKGLGIKFLKHIEKTRLLLHCIDVSDEHPEKAYDVVRKEFEEYNPQLLKKPELIVLNKSDLVDATVIKKITSVFKKKGRQIVVTSVYDDASILQLKEQLLSALALMPQS